MCDDYANLTLRFEDMLQAKRNLEAYYIERFHFVTEFENRNKIL